MSIFFPLKKGVCTIALAATVILTWANNLEAQTLSDDPVHAPHHVLSAEAREHTTEVAPGALPYSPETRTQLQKTLADKGPDYEPRTERVDRSGRDKDAIANAWFVFVQAQLTSAAGNFPSDRVAIESFFQSRVDDTAR